MGCKYDSVNVSQKIPFAINVHGWIISALAFSKAFSPLLFGINRVAGGHNWTVEPLPVVEGQQVLVVDERADVQEVLDVIENADGIILELLAIQDEQLLL